MKLPGELVIDTRGKDTSEISRLVAEYLMKAAELGLLISVRHDRETGVLRLSFADERGSTTGKRRRGERMRSRLFGGR
jgi:hypothetical protein